MTPDGFVDPEETRVLEEMLRVELANIEDGLVDTTLFEPYREHVQGAMRANMRYADGQARRLDVLSKLRAGMSVSQACDAVGVRVKTYSQWRARYPEFAAKADEAKVMSASNRVIDWDGTPASFHAKWFGRKLTWFQLLAINEMENMRLGNILLVLWPPDHGKTSTFEDHACRKLALKPDWRCLVGCESEDVAKKILGVVMNRMDPMGPTPGYVERFGPFMPQSGTGNQPWSDTRFRVHHAKSADQRDYSMAALGRRTRKLLSARSDQVHLDDIQSTETLGQTDKIEERVRQDFFTRAGEHGIITMFGSRVGDDDVYERLDDDDNLDSSLMKRIKLRAIITDPETGEQRPLWPERYNLEELERMRAKGGDEAFDRNFMMRPGASKTGRTTFSKAIVEPCKDPILSLQHRPTAGSILYVGLDPSIGGKNCVIACELGVNPSRLIVRRIVERVDLFNNQQIIDNVSDVIDWCERDGAETTDLIIEDKAFQAGLMLDRSLIELRKQKKFLVHGHKTGINKYDEDIGVPSMARSFQRGEIVLPWASDGYTREMVGELVSQLYRWKPFVRGNRLRQDMVMALWFCWIIWQNRVGVAPATRRGTQGFKTQGLPWAPTKTGLLVPTR